MSFYNFNPFGRTDIKCLVGANLKVLEEVTEGWYVDYKEEIIKLKTLSKHLSSFANQYGGWLFIGIKESSDRKAEDFIGILEADVEPALLRIREASTAHVNPTVYYEEKVIHGPVEDISLDEGKAIIIIYVPEGADSPYIHSTGRIYRRLADQSHPVQETDRHILDRLWEKGKNRRLKTKQFINERIVCSGPVVHVCLMANPLFDKTFALLGYDEFRKVFTGLGEGYGISMPMDVIHSVANGYIAKQTVNNDKLGVLLTVRWFHDGNVKLTIPLNNLTPGSTSISGAEHAFSKEFLVELSKQRLIKAKICDFTYLFQVLTALYNQVSELFRIIGISETIKAAIALENAKNMVPFIDDATYLEQIRCIGASTVENELVTVPYDLDSVDLISLEKRSPEEGESGAERVVRNFIEVLPVIAPLLNAIGVSNSGKEIATFRGLFTPGVRTNINADS